MKVATVQATNTEYIHKLRIPYLNYLKGMWYLLPQEKLL